MIKPWSVLYQGRLVIRKLTKAGAEAIAFRLAKEKGWNLADIAVQEG